MSKKIFTDESLETLVDEIKSNIDTAVSKKANSSHTHSISNVTNLQNSLDSKQPTISGAATTITSSNLTANRALISNGSGKVAVSAVTSTELGYLDGVTSSVQTQLDGKAASSHNHSASNITSGTLSSDRLPTVPISKGGTGATTAAGVLTNLGISATATELNYTDGVTSNIQTQLNGKSANGHTHSYAGSSSVGGSATSAEKLSSYVNLTSSGSSNVGKLIKFGTITLPSAWASCCGYLLFNTRESASGCVGILRLYVRLSSAIDVETATMQWISTNNTKYANAVKLVKTANGVFDLYLESMGTYEMNEITGIFGADSSKISLANSGTWVSSIEADYESSLSSISSSCNGNATTATTATKLGSSTVGSATQPIYLNGGMATACTYTLGKSVPSNAVFTDTNTKVTNTLATTTKAYITGTTSASTNTGTQVFDTGVYLDTTAGKLVATTFSGTTFSGSGVATLAEVQNYLGI